MHCFRFPCRVMLTCCLPVSQHLFVPPIAALPCEYLHDRNSSESKVFPCPMRAMHSKSGDEYCYESLCVFLTQHITLWLYAVTKKRNQRKHRTSGSQNKFIGTNSIEQCWMIVAAQPGTFWHPGKTSPSFHRRFVPARGRSCLYGLTNSILAACCAVGLVRPWPHA